MSDKIDPRIKDAEVFKNKLLNMSRVDLVQNVIDLNNSLSGLMKAGTGLSMFGRNRELEKEVERLRGQLKICDEVDDETIEYFSRCENVLEENAKLVKRIKELEVQVKKLMHTPPPLKEADETS